MVPLQDLGPRCERIHAGFAARTNSSIAMTQPSAARRRVRFNTDERGDGSDLITVPSGRCAGPLRPTRETDDVNDATRHACGRELSVHRKPLVCVRLRECKAMLRGIGATHDVPL